MNAPDYNAVAALLDDDRAGAGPDAKPHPFTSYLPFDGVAQPPSWVIPGFISTGVTVISGARGIGKTSAVLPLSLAVAGLHGADALMPRHWRHVIYISEDVEQVKNILAAMVADRSQSIDLADVQERFHLVQALRLDPAYVATVGVTYREHFTRRVNGVALPPLVIIDTKSAALSQENENDNSEAGAMMDALKRGFDDLPVWVVAHLSNANLNNTNVDQLSSRGASAVESDAKQTLFLVKSGESRQLLQGKKRFEPKWQALNISSQVVTLQGQDEFGEPETFSVRWCILQPATPNQDTAAHKKAKQAQDEANAVNIEVVDAVSQAWTAGNPLNRAGVKAKLSRKTSTVVKAIDGLLADRWLHEIDVPIARRIVASKKQFLIALTAAEHAALIHDGVLPIATWELPPSWAKPIPPVPEPGANSPDSSPAAP